METVFDHNIISKEWERINGDTSKSFYLSIINQEGAYRDIAALYYHRGDIKKATFYADKLSIDLRNDFWRLMTHP